MELTNDRITVLVHVGVVVAGYPDTVARMCMCVVSGTCDLYSDAETHVKLYCNSNRGGGGGRSSIRLRL